VTFIHAGSRDRSAAHRFAESAADLGGGPDADVFGWLAERRRANRTAVTRIPFAELDGWQFAPDTGNLYHRTRRFFTVEGLSVRMDHARVSGWSQPIIHQPEIAILGILAKQIDGVLRFLMQAKIEPGNVNTVQLSPTVQATPSNYTRVHGGAAPRYLEYFTAPDRGRRHVDVLQSEQGGWFFRKRNRNMIVEVDDEIEVHRDFRWFTLGELWHLLAVDNVVNADARTVLSCVPPPGIGPVTVGVAGSDALADALHWITDLRSRYRLDARLVPLAGIDGWSRSPMEIAHVAGRYFRVMAVGVEASSREVTRWSQPLIEPCGTGLIGFLLRRVDGGLHALVHARVEAGSRETVELAPTVQCQPDDLLGVPAAGRPPFLDALLGARPDQIRYDAVQSDEGGRFYRSQNRHLIVEVDDDFAVPLPEDYRWLALGQLAALNMHSNYLNIQARSLLLCLYSRVVSLR